MADSSRKAVREISLGHGFDNVTFLVRGRSVAISVGTVVLASLPAPVNGSAAKAKPRIGDVMPAPHKNAGWIYAGISQTTYEPFYAAPKDSGVFKWNEAMAFATRNKARVPSQEELNQLYEAQGMGALRGTFNLSGSYPDGCYLSATELLDFACYYAWSQRFNDGNRSWPLAPERSSLRLVRG